MTRMSYLEASRRAVIEELDRDPTVWVFGEDVANGGLFGQYAGLHEKYGPRVVGTAISEAAIGGAGVGAAMAGTRPIVDLRMADFALCAVDEIVNQAAKARYMLGGQSRIPLVMRMPTGIPLASAAQHSNCTEAFWVHTPGLVVIAPATPQDNKGLLKAAIRCDDPVIYMEHKALWRLEGEVSDDPDAVTPIGVCRIAHEGSDLTIVAWSEMVHQAVAAAAVLAGTHGISAEVVDLRTLWPWDFAGVRKSVEKTGNVLIAHEAPETGGFGAELYATLHSQFGHRLRQIQRLGAPRMPIPFSSALESSWRINAATIVAAAREMLGEQRPAALTG